MSDKYLPLSFQWHSSIDEINKMDWDRIFSGNILKSFDFFKAQCDADIENAQFMFLTVSSKNETLAIVPCFTYRKPPVNHVFSAISSTSIFVPKNKTYDDTRRSCRNYYVLQGTQSNL